MEDRRRAMYDGFNSVTLGHSKAWAKVANEFVERVFARGARVAKCPCSKCQNLIRLKKDDLSIHLCKYGFMPNYVVWHEHGEVLETFSSESDEDPNPHHLELLCDENTTKKLGRNFETLRERQGTDVAYKAGRGVAHGRESSCSVATSRPRPSSAREEELFEQMQNMQQQMQLMQQIQSQHMMMQGLMLQQFYGCAGPQFGIPPFSPPSFVPQQKKSKQPVNPSLPHSKISQGSKTQSHEQMKAPDSTKGGQVMPWGPPQSGMFWPQTQMPWGFPPVGQSQMPWGLTTFPKQAHPSPPS